MQPKKAIIIDVPIRKFMNERPQNRVIGRSGDPAIESQNGEALVATAGASGLSTREGGCERQALTPGAVCARRRANGAMCGRPADGGRDECWVHAEWYSLLPAVFGMPYPEDAAAIHQILARTMSMVISGEMSLQKAQAVTKLCRELRRNLMWYQREMGMW